MLKQWRIRSKFWMLFIKKNGGIFDYFPAFARIYVQIFPYFEIEGLEPQTFAPRYANVLNEWHASKLLRYGRYFELSPIA